MKGQRLYFIDGEPDFAYRIMQTPGAYGYVGGEHYTWISTTPNGLAANLRGHKVTEHEDGTITVTPSILCVQTPEAQWHGYLTNGEWKEC